MGTTTWRQHGDHRDVETTCGDNVETTWGQCEDHGSWRPHGDNIETTYGPQGCGDHMGTIMETTWDVQPMGTTWRQHWDNMRTGMWRQHGHNVGTTGMWRPCDNMRQHGDNMEDNVETTWGGDYGDVQTMWGQHGTTCGQHEDNVETTWGQIM